MTRGSCRYVSISYHKYSMTCAKGAIKSMQYLFDMKKVVDDKNCVVAKVTKNE